MPTLSRPRVKSEERCVPAPSVLPNLCSVLGRAYSARLDGPEGFGELANLKRDKEFCVGLLENPVNHAWWPEIKKLGNRERLSISGSMFLARKVLPIKPDPSQEEKHAALMSTPAPEVTADFLEHIDRSIDEIFKVGWDSNYPSHVYSHTPTSSSCREVSRSDGGQKSWVGSRGVSWFQDACLGEYPHPNDYSVNYMCVPTGGKIRGVTICDGHASLLGPLHRTMYDLLSQQEWLLRGEARGKKFKSFHKVEGEVFVSGDYESATDNLSLEATERILSRILFRARSVPLSMRRYAMRSLRALIRYPGGHAVEQRRGQLMGNYLSFPLLCLQNFIAFKYLIPRSVPVRINGDDIVFRSTKAEYHRWRKGVNAAGLTLSTGKTLVSCTSFSLNSAFFVAQRHRVREIPVIRATMLKSSDGIATGDNFAKFCRNWKLDARRLVGGLWLSSHKRQILASGRSVVGGLKIPADNSQLYTANLHGREAFYRGSKNGFSISENPLPPSPHSFSDRYRRSGWSLVSQSTWANSSEVKNWKSQMLESYHRQAWEPGLERVGCIAMKKRWRDWWSEVKETGYESSWHAWRKSCGRKMRIFRFLGVSLRIVPLRETKRRGVWIPTDLVPQYLCRKVGVGC